MSIFTLDPVTTTTADSKAIPFEDQLSEAISHLVDLWKSFHEKGLTVRHETGCMLNELIGPPSRRQDYGAAALERVSEQIGVSRSELSRMRKFAEAISDLDAFHRDHSECATWTKVKAHLATIDEKGRPVSDKSNRTSPAKGVCRSIKALTKRVNGIESDSKPADRQRVISELKDLAQAVRHAYGVTIQVETDQNSVSTTTDEHKGASRAA